MSSGGHYRHRYARTISKLMQKAFKKLQNSPAREGALHEAVTHPTNRLPHLMAYTRCNAGHVSIEQNAPSGSSV
jgi:hypothetical protein